MTNLRGVLIYQRFVHRAATAVLGALLVFSLANSSASADTRFGETPAYPFFVYPGAMGYSSAEGIAVNEASGGDVYFPNGESLQRVDVFHPNGSWALGFGFGIVPGAGTATGDLTAGATLITNVQTVSGSVNESGLAGKLISGPGIPPNTSIINVNNSELTLSKPATSSGTGVTFTVAAGPGNVPVNETQQIKVNATSGQFTLSFTSPKPGSTTQTTPSISATATAAEVQEALEGLSNIGAGNVSVSGGPGDAEGTMPYRVTFVGKFADVNVLRMATQNVSLSGGVPSSSVQRSTPQEGGGVTETCTTVCGFPSGEEDAQQSGQGFSTNAPGSFNYSDAIAVDNDPSSPSYGDVYVTDERNYRVEKFSASGQFLLMFGDQVDKTTNADVCTATDIAGGDVCAAGLPGTGPSAFYKEEPPTFAGGFKDWAHNGSNSIVVGPAGVVYVGDLGRVQEFEPNGTFKGELALPDAEPRFVSALTVDSAGNIYERSATYNEPGSPPTSEIPGVREYNSAHTLVRTIDNEPNTEPTHLGIDAAGNVYMSEPNHHNGTVAFKKFRPNGDLAAVFTSEELQTFNPNSTYPPKVGGIAIGNAAHELYATTGEFEGGYIAVVDLPVDGPPTATEAEAINIQPTTATLKAVVNPHGFDTHYRFEYVDKHSFETEGGYSSPHTQVTPIPPHDLGLVDQKDVVQAAISGLTPGTAYEFRVVAESTAGTAYGNGEFASLEPISVRNLTTQTVGPELVTIKAELNPNGKASTYKVQIGQTTAYADGFKEGTLPVGNEYVLIEATISGLKSNTLYHYQIVGDNEYGHTATPDKTLTTEPSSAEERAAESCPNTNLREENNSTALPDCRAYEQVSARRKEGGEAFPLMTVAPSGQRAVYVANGAFAGAATNEIAVQYLAQRTESGWESMAPVHRIPNSDYQPGGFPTFTPELDKWVYSEHHGLNFEHQDQSSLFYSLGRADGTFVQQATPIITETSGESFSVLPDGQANDLSKEFILTSRKLLASDPRPSDHGNIYVSRIYELSGIGSPAAELKLVAETPLGLSDDSCRVSNFVESTGGNTGGQADSMSSADGETIIYTQPVEVIPGQPCGGEGRTANQFALYARINGGAPVQLNTPPPSQCHAPSPCASSSLISPLVDGISRDGKRVWFETPQPLVDGDEDETNDVYMAKLGAGGLEELVQVSAGEATTTHPTPGKGAEVGEEGINNFPNHGVARVSKDGKFVTYESMNVLTENENGLHQKALAGANNLYLYNTETHETSFVVELCSGIEFSGSDRANRSGAGVYYEVTKKNAIHDGACPTSSKYRKRNGEEVGTGFENLIGYGGPCGVNDDQIWIYDCNGGQAIFSENDRYFFFTSWGRITPDDTDNVRDLYRYDVQTGDIQRLSFGRNGNDANGNDNEFPVVFQHGIGGTIQATTREGDEERNISSDGSVVIFRTAAPLIAHDTNTGNQAECGNGVQGTGCDLYMWEEQGHGTCTEAGGCLRLISDGVDPHGVPNAVLSASGNDVMFETQRNLIPADTDGVGDIYDARVNGGFHTPHEPPQCTSSETCHASPPAEGGAPTIGTETNVSGGNAPEHLKCGKGRVRVKKHGQIRCVPKKHHHKKHQGGKKRTHRGLGGAR